MRIAALALALAAFTPSPLGPALATEEPEDTLSFDGRVAAFQEAELSSRLDGQVAKVLFTGGERIEAGTPMIRLDSEDLELAVAAARAELTSAEAAEALARSDAARIRTLETRGVASGARADSTEAALKEATAQLELARVALRRAELARRWTVIRAPIDGFASRPATAVGAFVEAESGVPLGKVARIDPVLVEYRVPYEVRLESMARTGAESLETLFEQVQLALRLPDGRRYRHPGKPDFASIEVDPKDGALTVWGLFPNPNAILRPGMSVTVLSEVASKTQAGKTTP